MNTTPPRLYALVAVMLLPLLAACTAGPATLDAARLAEAGAGTLEVIGAQAAAQETLTATAQWPTHTPTPTVTATPTPTLSPTATDTPTPTPVPSGMVAAADKLRAGPGTVYPTVVSLAGGEVARPLGQTTAGDWLLIALKTGEEGWLPAESFSLDDSTIELLVITDIPPTPTLPPATPTPSMPPPTATGTASPYTCDLSITREGDHIILIGLGWPPKAPTTMQITRHYSAPITITNPFNWVSTGDEDDLIPNGFWVRWHTGIHYFDGAMWVYMDGPTTYTVSTWACSGTATTSP